MAKNVENVKNTLGEDFSNLPHWDQFNPNEHKANIWSDDYVKLPFSSMNMNELTNRGLWETIIFSLNHLSNNLDKCKNEAMHGEIKHAILKYRPEYARDHAYNLENLFFLFESYSGPRNTNMSPESLKSLLKKMIESALNLKKFISKPIPVIKKGTSQSLSFNSEQCASLLANCFFCTFPSVHSNQNLTNPNFIR